MLGLTRFLILRAFFRALVRTGAVAGMEIITGVERRRRWRTEDKLRILAELSEPGAKFVDVARRHDVSRGLLWQWRDAQRRGVLVMEEATFMPVRVVPELDASENPLVLLGLT